MSEVIVAKRPGTDALSPQMRTALRTKRTPYPGVAEAMVERLFATSAAKDEEGIWHLTLSPAGTQWHRDLRKLKSLSKNGSGTQ